MYTPTVPRYILLHKPLKMVKLQQLFKIMMMAHQLQHLLLMEMMDQSQQIRQYPTLHIQKLIMDTLKQQLIMIAVVVNQ